MTQAEFLVEIDRLERELGTLIETAHANSPPTVEWVAMLTWASCCRAQLMGLREIGLPDSETPLEPSKPVGSFGANADQAMLECLFCKRPRELDSKYCDRHRGGIIPPEDFQERK